jgi:hypothetical protein
MQQVRQVRLIVAVAVAVALVQAEQIKAAATAAADKLLFDI